MIHETIIVSFLLTISIAAVSWLAVQSRREENRTEARPSRVEREAIESPSTQKKKGKRKGK
jgi:hypothetical protein